MMPTLSLHVEALIDAWWRAANYLSEGQAYLRDNSLLQEPLQRVHIRTRLLGHWGTTPGLNFIYAHLNRVIRQRDLGMIYITGSGHDDEDESSLRIWSGRLTSPDHTTIM